MKLSRGSILESVASGVLRLDAVSRVTWVNPAAARLLARPVSDIIGRDVRTVVGAGTPLRGLLPVDLGSVIRDILVLVRPKTGRRSIRCCSSCQILGLNPRALHYELKRYGLE